MAGLPFDTWLRLVLWVGVGAGIYGFYGARRSHVQVALRAAQRAHEGLDPGESHVLPLS
jgi:hypothetical protein